MDYVDEVAPAATERARRATAEDLARLYRERGRAFAAVAAGICGEAAGDAVHDAFVRALSRLGGLRAHGSLEGWVWRIVLNEARRRAAARPLAELAPVEERAAASADGPDAAVRALVASLPERQRAVVFLRYYADLDEAAIGAALGIRRGTVAATLHQVHARVRASLLEAREDDR